MTAVQIVTIIGYTSCIVSVMGRAQQRERARKRAASDKKKLDMRFFVPFFFVSNAPAHTRDHNSSSLSASAVGSSSSLPEISPETEITAATYSSLPSTLVEIYGQESPFIPGRFHVHYNMPINLEEVVVRYGQFTQNGTQLCNIPYHTCTSGSY